MTKNREYTNEELVKKHKGSFLNKAQRETINLMEEGYTLDEVAELRGLKKYNVERLIETLNREEEKNRKKMEEIKQLQKYSLTDIQRKIVRLLVEGNTIKGVADIRGTSEGSINAALAHIKKKGGMYRNLKTYEELEENGGKYKKHDGGLLLVDKNGEGYRWNKTGYEKVPITLDKDGRKTTSYMSKKGLQNRVYVHRVVAELYIKNPKNLKYVDFKDGKKGNVKASNLKWVDTTEDMRKTYEKRGEILKNALGKCEICGNPAHKKICYDCKKKEKQRENKENKIENLKEYYKGFGKVKMSVKDERTVKERVQGKTLKEIGQKDGITREAVRLRLVRIKIKIQERNRLEIK